MELILLFAALFFLLAIGVPVAFALLGASLITFFALDLQPVVVIQRMASGMSVFALIAIPFFVFAGDLMYRSGIAARIVSVAEAALGRSRGGLGQVTVGASMLFGAVSGSAIASASAMGSALTPLMRSRGYSTDYAVNVTTTAAIVGLLIPPSHNMIIYAASAGRGISVGDLFLAGVFPGILTGLILMFVAWRVAIARGYPAGTFPGWRGLLIAFAWAIPGLMTAVIIMGGILSGLFTATESSAIAVIYTIAVGALVYRSLGWKRFVEACKQSVRITAMVLFIVGAATSFGYLLALLEAPARISEAISAISSNPLVILLIINIVLLILGTFMDMSPLIVITTPIFLPIVVATGVDPVHFGIIMMLNLGIGLVTPPVGSVLFVGCAIGNIPIEKALKTIWPFYGALVFALILVTYVPEISLWLPNYVNAAMAK